ncbi:MAG: translation initiation factor IF-2 N-terminal domain-containing protein, partial [Oscillospiraceae bacterium]|nr:translation initiation factor IF-2 N-terminal domain-containing protein [Oscillospiraceae bacterium]
MSIVFKYRVHEVAKDFKLQTKDITEIMTEYASTPKNHMQVLTEDELDIIFEYLTQHNQISSIEEIYAVSSPKADISEPPKKEEKAETKQAAPAA